MRIHIHLIDEISGEKGRLAGEVTYKSQNLRLNSLDSRLDDIVNSVYKKILNGTVSVRHYTQSRKHKILTSEFVEAFGVECWKNGYMIEVVE